MAFISSFSIEGLAGRSDVYARSLRPDLNIFFGLNGSGKTTLLKILHSALRRNTKILQDLPFSEASVTIEWRGDAYTFTLERKGDGARRVVMVDGRATVRHGPTLTWVSKPDMSPGGFGHSYLPTTRLYGASEPRNFPEDPDEAQIDATFAALLQTTWTRYNSKMLQTVRTAQEEGLTALVAEIIAPNTVSSIGVPTSSHEVSDSIEKVHERVSSFLARQPGRRFLVGSIEYFRQRFNDEPQFRNVVQHLSTVEGRIAEAVAPRSQLESLLNRLFTNKTVSISDAEISVKSGKDAIPIALLSSGEKHAMRLFVEALSGHSNPIIIDEPELSLHVDWQHELVAAMRELKPGCQLILATHSPEIMAGADDSAIFRL